ncbi:MAG: ABC transporter ATP-binding protein [Myxococcales bacterium]|nr:ABC transporter ATP-binding protein [Myxococcales bacterium]
MTDEATKTGIWAARVSKWYGSVTALSDVSVHIEPGVWGLLGPNGSGKSTFLQLVAGLLRPNLGELRVNGESPFDNPRVLQTLGFAPEADALYDDLTALEFVSGMAELHGIPRGEARDRARAILTTLGLDGAQDRRLGTFSRGMRQRAKLAQALLHEPRVLLLDEPLTGTDPHSKQVILEELRRRGQGGTLILFSTHVLHEVEALTEQVILIARGRLVAQGKTHEIRNLIHEHPHTIRVVCDRPRDLGSAMMATPSVVQVSFPEPRTVHFRTDDPEESYAALQQSAVLAAHEIESITSPDASLEALFHHLVERAGSAS